MTSLMRSHVRMAMGSLKNAKGRSILTMLGIVVGVVAVITTIAIGEGVKRQVSHQVKGLGSDLITVRPGRISANEKNQIHDIALPILYSASTIKDTDVEVVRQTAGVASIAPISYFTGTAIHEDVKNDSFVMIGTTYELPELITQKVSYGTFFGAGDGNKHFAVIGKRVAEVLFNENVPVGKMFTIRGQEFVVRGVLDEFETSPISIIPDYNRAIFIPYSVAAQLTEGNAKISQLIIKPKKDVAATATAVKTSLLKAHKNEEDFTVLRQDEMLAVTNRVFNLLTAMISAIAGISLFVAGIGIMNIMLVSVTERTHEVGIRKAIGASNPQILGQFLTEAIVISIFGGLLGIGLSYGAVAVITILTDLTPVITWPVVALASGVSLIVGSIFGIAPAIKAARKDPIQALRHE